MTSKYLRIWLKSLSLNLSADLAYKWNFIIKCIAIMLVDFMGPIVAVLIYSNSSGIPGWSFEQFIFFTGTVTLVFGINHVFFVMFPVKVIENVRNGDFDQFLVKPFSPLLLLTFSAWDLDGFAEVLVGIVLLVWSVLNMQVVFTVVNVLIYIFLLLVAVLFQYAVMIVISSVAFLVVKSWGLFDLFWDVSKFARYPLDIFGNGIRFVFTFLFPIAISAHYPSKFLLDGFTLLGLISVVLPVFGFFALSLLLWNWAMRNYTSAGG